MQNYIGVLEDDRSHDDRAKDYRSYSIELYSAISVNWIEKKIEDWKRFTTRNQDGSGSCVAQAFAKAYEIIYGKDVYSATPIFSRRQNRPTTGMYLYNAGDIAKKKGNTIEALCVSQNMNDLQMDESALPETPKTIGGYVYNNYTEIETIAEAIEKYKHCILTFTSNYQEWTSIPTFMGTETKWGHCVCAVDYVLYQGKKYIVIEDSWGHGATDFDDRRLISEDFIKNRCTGAVSILPTQVATPVFYVFKNVLVYGSTGKDVVMLQDALKYLGFMPSGVPSTGYYGSITTQAVNKFQLAYKEDILTPLGLNAPTGKFGTSSIKKLNQLLMTNNKWYSSSNGSGNLSLTLKGLAVALIPAIIYVLHSQGINITDTQVETWIENLTTIISGVMVLWGLARKIYNRIY